MSFIKKAAKFVQIADRASAVKRGKYTMEWTTSPRQNFVNTFLSEMPEGIGITDLADKLEYFISDHKKAGIYPVQTLAGGLKKIEGDQILFYWYEDKNGKFLLGAELDKSPYAAIVREVGKFKKGRPPYASDLYAAIINDRRGSIRLMSDETLSDEGLLLWKRLVTQGFKVSVYDQNEPGKSFKQLTDPASLDQFFKDDDRSHRRYQYIVSESGHSIEVRHLFETRRLRELTPKLL